MAKNSIITFAGDGVTTQFTVNFTGGYASEDHVFCQVNEEVDGSGDPVYRTITFASEVLITVGGTVPQIGEEVRFTRQTPIDAPVNDFGAGAQFSSTSIDDSFEQVLFGIQEAQDSFSDAADAEISAAAAASSAAAAAVSAAAALASELAAGIAQVAAELAQTGAETAETNAETAETNAAASAAAALVSENAAAADAILTAADVVSTNADVVTTAADAATTTQDAIDTAADAVSTDADATAAAASAVAAAASAAAAATFDPDAYAAIAGDTLTGGFVTTEDGGGTQSSGTFTPAPSDNNFHTATNGGAFTLAHATETEAYSMVLYLVNNGSAGVVTLSGFDIVTGDDLTTTDTEAFFIYITSVDSNSHLHIVALQ